MPPTTAEPASLVTRFASPFSEHAHQWNSCYNESYTPWDRAGPSYALADLVQKRLDLIPPAQERDSRGNPLRDASGATSKRTALVPGCGRGYDVLLLSSLGYNVLGLDASKTAIDEARKNQHAAEKDPAYATPDDVERGNIDWVVGDFFADDWVTGAGADATGKFDLIFDYTFLCALPLDVRPQWAKRMTELLSSKGRLVCLEFPTSKPLSEAGPPWGVWPEVYEALLSSPGDPVSYNDDGTVVETTSPKPREDALHRLSLIKPLRTHAAGTNEDGTARDFISVWSR